jgi:hypothetical protein
MKTDMFSEKNIQQSDSIADERVIVDFHLKDTITTVYNKKQK